MKLNRWSLFAKMTAVIAVFAAVLIALGLFATRTRNRVQVGGPYYAQIALSKDLVADILPPPATSSRPTSSRSRRSTRPTPRCASRS